VISTITHGSLNGQLKNQLCSERNIRKKFATAPVEIGRAGLVKLITAAVISNLSRPSGAHLFIFQPPGQPRETIEKERARLRAKLTLPDPPNPLRNPSYTVRTTRTARRLPTGPGALLLVWH